MDRETTAEAINNDRVEHGHFAPGNSLASRYRAAKLARIAAKADELASQYGGWDALGPIDAGRVKLAAKHLDIAEHTSDANQCTRSTRTAEMLLSKIERQNEEDEIVPSLASYEASA